MTHLQQKNYVSFRKKLHFCSVLIYFIILIFGLCCPVKRLYKMERNEQLNAVQALLKLDDAHEKKKLLEAIAANVLYVSVWFNHFHILLFCSELME